MNPEIETQPELKVETDTQCQPQPQIQVQVQPQIQVQPDLQPVLKNKQRHFLAVFFLSFMWGTFGADRFYLGKYGTGILKLVTFGGFGLWTLIDLALIMNGAMRDKQGKEMLEFERYRKFAGRTVLIFSLVVLMIVVVSGVSLVYTLMQLFQNGGIQNLIPSSGQIPGADQLQGLTQMPGL